MGVSAVVQYAVVLVNLYPTQGSEMKKTRPCVVVSPDELNGTLRTCIIAPMTSTPRAYPTRVVTQFQGQPGAVALDQLRVIDKSRIIRSLGKLQPLEIQHIKEVIKAMLVD